MGQAPWHCGTWQAVQGTGQLTWLACWAGGQWQGPAGCAVLTWLNRWDRTVSGSVLVRPESCGGSTGSYGTTMAGSCPREPPAPGVGQGPAHLGSCPVNPAFAIGVDVHEDQSFNQVREDELQQEG